MPFLHLAIQIISAIITILIIVVVIGLIWYFFFKGDDTTDNFIEFDDCDRSVRPWWWYDHMRDNLYFTPTYAYNKIFYDGRPHDEHRHYKRKFAGSRHPARHGPNHGKLRQ